MSDAVAGVIVIFQCFVAWFVFSVWTWRFHMETSFRAMGATSIPGEFAAYGYPPYFWKLIMVLKLCAAACLIAGLLVPAVTCVGAFVLVILMAGAVLSHVKVGDPAARSGASGTMLVMSLCMIAADSKGSAGIVAPTEDFPACLATLVARKALCCLMVIICAGMFGKAATEGAYTSKINQPPLLG
jgi:uncharacterized membrane protein YphA (DoxX/SURF4 family)